MSNRKTFEETKQMIKDGEAKPGFTKKWYEKNYKNPDSVIPLICLCGNHFSIKAQTLRDKTKKKCRDCQLKAKSEKGKKSYEDLIKEIKERKCKPEFAKRWYNDHYKGVATELPLICSCKKSFIRSYKSFKINPLCDTCRIEQKGNKRLSYEQVKKVVEERTAIMDFTSKWFHEHYRGNETLLPLICSCKKPFTLSYKRIQSLNEVQCEDCKERSEMSSQKKYQRLLQIAMKDSAVLAMTPEWVESNKIERDTPITCSCKCGTEITLPYQKVLPGNFKCKACKKIAGKEERLLRAMYEQGEHILNNLNVYEKELYE